jgi:hypothetical protein
MVVWGGRTIEGPEGTWSGRHYGLDDDTGMVGRPAPGQSSLSPAR